jgi:hypothetical protein
MKLPFLHWIGYSLGAEYIDPSLIASSTAQHSTIQYNTCRRRHNSFVALIERAAPRGGDTQRGGGEIGGQLGVGGQQRRGRRRR